MRWLRNPWNRFLDARLEARLDARIAQRTGCVPIDQTRPDDVFLIAYPKSGMTWLQLMLAAAAFGIDPVHTPDRLVQQLLPDRHKPTHYRRWRDGMMFKSHELPRPAFRRVVHLVRDVRDVMASYFHYHQAIGKPFASMRDMIEQSQSLFPCAWEAHAAAWRENPHGAQVLPVRYEDLHTQPLHELRRICAFIGLDADEQRLATIVERSAFGRMKQRERKLGWEDWPKDQPFVRKGQVGGYREDLSPEDEARLMARAGGELARWYPQMRLDVKQEAA